MSSPIAAFLGRTDPSVPRSGRLCLPQPTAAKRSIHDETRLEQAYHVILACALIGLRVKGYRPGRGAGSHELTLQTLTETLRLDPGRLDYYQALRRQRHQGLYEGFVGLSPAGVEEAVREARDLLTETLAWLRDHFPTLAPEELGNNRAT